MPWMPRLLFLVALGLFAGRADAQVEPSLKVGAKVAGFKVQAVTGENAGKVVDFVAERKDKPTVFAFVRAKDFDRPMSRFLKALDEELSNGIAGVTDPATVAVWLTDDPKSSVAYLPRAQQSLNLNRSTLAVFEGSSDGPEGWALDLRARLSVVVVRDGKVAGIFGYISLNETDVAAVVEAIKAK